MENNKVTIIIPVYERIEFFKEALNSALNQTVKTPILVIDNGSNHKKFQEICNQYQNRIEYIKNESNIGMYPNWNKGISNCKTEYFIILGDDDILDLNYIEEFFDILEKYKNIDIYYTDFYFLENESQEIIPSKWNNFWGSGTGNDILKIAKKEGLKFPTISSVIKTSLFKNNCFYEGVHASNDWEWIYRNVKNLKIYGNKKRKLRYRRHKLADTQNVITKLNCKLSNLAITTYLFEIESSIYLDKKIKFKNYLNTMAFIWENELYIKKLLKNNENEKYLNILKENYLNTKLFNYLRKSNFLKIFIKIIKKIRKVRKIENKKFFKKYKL